MNFNVYHIWDRAQTIKFPRFIHTKYMLILRCKMQRKTSELFFCEIFRCISAILWESVYIYIYLSLHARVADFIIMYTIRDNCEMPRNIAIEFRERGDKTRRSYKLQVGVQSKRVSGNVQTEMD